MYTHFTVYDAGGEPARVVPVTTRAKPRLAPARLLICTSCDAPIPPAAYPDMVVGNGMLLCPRCAEEWTVVPPSERRPWLHVAFVVLGVVLALAVWAITAPARVPQVVNL